ncbi:exodeoxyribonuclease III [Actinomadura luteofluorescens]|uniref:exodeoxyribonuclease III n=1 Tax=Actinomadura luteofluorescens TaxID=46163 RepID=UPI00362E28A5
MRLATWNVNSVKARLPRLLAWLDETKPDVVCLQETKCRADLFPAAEVEELGYATAAHGDGRWNGVAVLSRVGIEDVSNGFPGEPAYAGEAGTEGEDEQMELNEPVLLAPEARAIGATCGGVRVWSLYAPNGRTPESAHYTYKLAWFAALRDALAEELAAGAPLVACGDYNVAPTDEDVWDPAVFAAPRTSRPPNGRRSPTCGPSASATSSRRSRRGPTPTRTGITGPRVPQEHGHAHRPVLRERGRRRTGRLRLRRPGGPQGQGPVRPRPGRRRSRLIRLVPCGWR